jgi:hypothetical protein
MCRRLKSTSRRPQRDELAGVLASIEGIGSNASSDRHQDLLRRLATALLRAVLSVLGTARRPAAVAAP